MSGENVRRVPTSEVGWEVFSRDGHLVGRVEAVFADYLLVRTASLLPVDLYVPSDGIVAAADGRVLVTAEGSQAYERWHRPLKSAPHP